MKQSVVVFFLALILILIAGSRAPAPAFADDMMEYVGHYNPAFFVHWLDVHLVGDRAYVPGLGGLAIFDIGAANPPEFITRYNPSSGTQFYHASASTPLTYVTARDRGIFVLDATTVPPALVATHDEGSRSFEGIQLDGNLIYVAAHDDGLRIYDVSNPQSFQLHGSLGGFTNAWTLDKQGDWLAVADAEGGLRLVDVTDPAQPALVATIPTSGAAQDVVWKGNQAYVASGSGGVDIFDLSAPGSPVFLGNYLPTSGSAFLLAADPAAERVYVATWQMVEAIDVTDPTNPVQAGFEDTPFRAMGVAADADHIYVADWNTFRMYEFGPTTNPDALVSPGIVSFPVVPIGQSADTTLTVANTGGAPLTLTNIRTGNPDFQVNPVSFQVPIDGEVEVTLTVSPTTDQGVGDLKVISNDPDESGLGHLIDHGTVGTQAPDFTLNDLGGVPHTLSDLQGEIVLLAFFASW
jgi:hypothetical protein